MEPINRSVLRLVLGLAILLAVLLPSCFQPAIDLVWSILRSSTIFKASTFETGWTVFCYAAIEVPLTVVFLDNPQWRLSQSQALEKSHFNITPSSYEPRSKDTRKARGMRRPSRRLLEILTYILPLLLMDLTMIKKFANVSAEEMLLSGNYNASMTAESAHGNTFHKTFLVPTIHNFTWSSPLQTQRALPLLAPSTRRIVVELFCSLFLFDFFFFIFHLMLHRIPILKNWHIAHHKYHEVHPQVTNQLSVGERLGLVLLANFSLNIIGSHVLTRALFIPTFIWLLVEIHSGCDLPWGYEKILPKGLGGGARKHAIHHRTGEGGLEPFLCWADSALNLIDSRVSFRT